MVGTLLYVAMCTCPDITHAVGAVSKFCFNSKEVHKTAVKRIFCYLKKIVNLALKYCKDEKQVIGFSDANWRGDLDDRHSTTGNVFLLAGGAISLLSKKQTVVALSTSEAGYVSLSLAVQEGEWLQKLFTDLQIPPKTIVIKEDNQGLWKNTTIAQNSIAYSRTNNISIRFHFIRKALKEGIVILIIVPHLRWSLIYQL